MMLLVVSLLHIEHDLSDDLAIYGALEGRLGGGELHGSDAARVLGVHVRSVLQQDDDCDGSNVMMLMMMMMLTPCNR